MDPTSRPPQTWQFNFRMFQITFCTLKENMMESLVMSENRCIVSWIWLHLRCGSLRKLYAWDFNRHGSFKSIIAKSDSILPTWCFCNIIKRWSVWLEIWHNSSMCFPRKDKSSNQLSRCALINIWTRCSFLNLSCLNKIMNLEGCAVLVDVCTLVIKLEFICCFRTSKVVLLKTHYCHPVSADTVVKCSF